MCVHLQHNLRAEEFSNLLLDVGDGKLLKEEGRINIPGNLCDLVGDLMSLSDRIYPNIQQAREDCTSWLRERAILTPTNDSANSINNFLLEKLPSEHMRYESVDSAVEVEDAVGYITLWSSCILSTHQEYHLTSSTSKLAHVVKTLQKHVIEATIFTGVSEGETVFIPRIPLIPSDYHFQFKHLQFPVKVC